MKSRRWLAWTAVALVVLLLAAGIVRMLAARKAQQAALAQSVGTQAQAGIELTGGDIVSATRRPLQQGLPLSGTVRALQSAVVKARVAGEVLDLVVREGDTVRAGQVVARIEPTEYNARLRELGEAYRAVMGRHFPAMTCVEVSRLVEPRARVEIEVTAVLPDDRP